jgi:hypothetical protein
VILGFKLKVSCLLGRYSTTWAMLSPFAFLSRPALTAVLLLMPPLCWDDRCTPPNLASWVSLTFCPDWLLTAIHLISVSQVAEIINMSYHV